MKINYQGIIQDIANDPTLEPVFNHISAADMKRIMDMAANQIIYDFVMETDRRAVIEAAKMGITGRISGPHYSAMKEIMKERKI